MQALLLAAIIARFWEELRSRQLAAAMRGAVSASAAVVRDGAETAVDIKDVAPGDVVLLSAGSLVPGDVRLLEARNLFVRCAAAHALATSAGIKCTCIQITRGPREY